MDRAVFEDEAWFFEHVQTTPDRVEAEQMVRSAMIDVKRESLKASRAHDNDRCHALGLLRERLKNELHYMQQTANACTWQAAVKEVCGEELYAQCVEYIVARRGCIG